MTSSVRLRPLVDADADLLAGWGEDRRFRTQAGWSDRSPAESRGFWLTLIAEQAAAARVEGREVELLRLGAVSDGELVGYVDLHGGERSTRELGFVVGPSERWGRGLGRAVAVAGLEYGIRTLRLDVITAEVAATNAASLRIVRSLGMADVGPGSGVEFAGSTVPSRWFRLTRSA